jgi:hypothetical protein
MSQANTPTSTSQKKALKGIIAGNAWFNYLNASIFGLSLPTNCTLFGLQVESLEA